MQISLTHAKLDALLLELLADGTPRHPRDLFRPNNLNPEATRLSLLRLVRAGQVCRDGEIGHMTYRIASPTQKDSPHAIAPSQEEIDALPLVQRKRYA